MLRLELIFLYFTSGDGCFRRRREGRPETPSETRSFNNAAIILNRRLNGGLPPQQAILRNDMGSVQRVPSVVKKAPRRRGAFSFTC